MPNSPQSINFIHSKQIPIFDKFMNWALTVGRLIVIITEIVALLAFVYRFSLDEKLIDLHSAIKQKQALISLLKKDENKYRNLHDRIALASDFSEKSIKTNKIIQNIIDLIPLGIIINDWTLNKEKINMSLNMPSASKLSELVNNLKNSSEIKSISIDNIENKPSIGLLVTITTVFK